MLYDPVADGKISTDQIWTLYLENCKIYEEMISFKVKFWTDRQKDRGDNTVKQYAPYLSKRA